MRSNPLPLQEKRAREVEWSSPAGVKGERRNLECLLSVKEILQKRRGQEVCGSTQMLNGIGGDTCPLATCNPYFSKSGNRDKERSPQYN
ncbi:hypothetical protein BaRGS_00038126, partial [Batillaria attramentaria]